MSARSIVYESSAGPNRRRTSLGRELRAWRDSLVANLGGSDAVSTQQLALVEKPVTQKLICDSLDGYVLQMGPRR
jgi:hypothetical protein